MADNNQQEDNKPKPNTLAENAAVEYGLEDHEATQQDPRVRELRRIAEMAQPKKTMSGQLPPPLPTATSSDEAPPLKSALKRESTDPTESPPPPPPPPPPPTTPQVLSPQPRSTAAPPSSLASVSNNAQTEPRSNKAINTDISFDPGKQFACKTTNTTGNMYEDDEPKPAETPPPPPTAYYVDDIFDFAVVLVRNAGAMALESSKAKQRLTYTTKEHERDLNTRTDNEVEAMLIKAINGKYPDHKIIAEEEVSKSATGEVKLTNEPTWVIDPIDGTMNFVHKFPHYCISVAFLIDKSTVFGIIFNPAMQEFYSARKFQGALLNDEPIHTSGQAELKNAMVLQEYGSGMDEGRTNCYMENANRLIKKTHALRSIGSSAMGLAMVASGNADAFYFFGLHIWDMAAGNLLVTEAGGTVIDPAGGEVDILSRRVLAAASHSLAVQLAGELSQNYPKPRDDECRIVPNAEPPSKDFNAQTEFSDSSISLTSSDHSLRRR
ncbi:hypothetical protein KR044_010766 [Drosophila immigrans]|nr:hypothetical protein KR044_010766 [Drosophila immigrans]